MNIETYIDFEKYIENDMMSPSVKCVRFVNIESLDAFAKVKNFLIEKTKKHLMLSDFCASDDLIANMDYLKRDLRSISENTVVLPLSEHLRINNKNTDKDLSEIALMEFENNSYPHNLRLYIPVYKMEENLRQLLKIDDRLKDCVVFLNEQIDDDYSLTILSKDVEIYIEGNHRFGIKDYLKYWEDKPNKPIILHTENAKYYKSSVYADDVKVLVSPFDIICHYNKIGEKISEEYGEDWAWSALLDKFKKHTVISEIYAEIFKTSFYDANIIFSNWNKYEDFEKWLLWLWTKYEVKAGYLSFVKENCESYKDLYIGIINSILDLDFRQNDFENLFFERLSILKSIDIKKFPASFWEKYRNKTDQDKLNYLTDSTREERVEFVGIISKIGVSAKNINIINKRYDNFGYYLYNYSFENEYFSKYFEKYKICKILNKFSDEFLSEVNGLACKKGIFWAVNHREKIILDRYTDKSIILWVDGLGVDNLGFIESLLTKKYPSIYKRITVAQANIPTITENNKEFLENRNVEKFKELDGYKHEGQFPEYIEYEFELLVKIINNAIKLLDDNYDNVIITSDHGMSRGAVVANNKTHPKKDTTVAKRLGRYAIDNNYNYESEIESCIDKDGSHIIANYDRFSESGYLRGEIHGGATLEEVLVPIIEISKTQLTESIIVEPLKQKIKKGERVKFKINKNVESLNVIVDGVKYNCNNNNNGEWSFVPTEAIKDSYIAKIMSNGCIGEFEFSFDKGLVQNKKFDI